MSSGNAPRTAWSVAADDRELASDARPKDGAGFDLVSPRPEDIPVAPHIAHACHAVRNEQPERRFPQLRGRQPGKSQMHMHVPQTRDEELAAGIDYARIFRRANLGANFGDAAAGQ